MTTCIAENMKQKKNVISEPQWTKQLTYRFLDESIRVISYRNAKIKHVPDNISKMDLPRFKNLKLHVGGHDIDANIDQTTFREVYQSLLSSVSDSGCKVYMYLAFSPVTEQT